MTLLFNSALSGAGGCWIQYQRAANALYLVNDAGSGLAPGSITPGTAGTLSNSQCTVANAGVATISGNNAALPVHVTFAAGFAGPKTVYAAASTNAHVDGSWQAMGTWISGAASPSVVSVSPINGTGASQTFTATYFSAAGGADLANMSLLLNSSFSGAGGCWIQYQRASNTLYLVNDAGSGVVAGSLHPGTAGMILNSQCAIVDGGAARISGNDLALPMLITFSTGFSGLMNVYAAASTNAHVDSVWQTMGTWKTGTTPAPTVVSVLPINGSGPAQTFTATYSDVAGGADLASVTFLFNSSLNPVAACWVQYQRASNTLFLIDDAGSGPVPGSMNPGTPGTLANNQCSIASAGAVTIAGNNLSLPLAINFAAGWPGLKNVYAAASTNGHVDGAWKWMGTWRPH